MAVDKTTRVDKFLLPIWIVGKIRKLLAKGDTLRNAKIQAQRESFFGVAYISMQKQIAWMATGQDIVRLFVNVVLVSAAQ